MASGSRPQKGLAILRMSASPERTLPAALCTCGIHEKVFVQPNSKIKHSVLLGQLVSLNVKRPGVGTSFVAGDSNL